MIATLPRTWKWLSSLVIGTCTLLYALGWIRLPIRGRMARRISPHELMTRPLAQNLQAVPKILHQSWSSDELPHKFESWSQSCRMQHADWEYVLWTDNDNERLVKDYFPWLLEEYQSLPGPIFRADLVRNIYMYLYGGMYADLDTECLRPTDEIFHEFNTSTITQTRSVDPLAPGVMTAGRKAFFGRMGSDKRWDNSVPNAWMASTPGHPFFLFSLERFQKSIKDQGHKNTRVEWLTGPAALFNNINEYNKKNYREDKLDTMLEPNPSSKLFPPHGQVHHGVDVLPFQYIYPYSWHRDGEGFRDICWSAKPTFDAERCKQLLATDRWPSYTITYWSHTWTEKDAHDTSHLELLQ